jgi:two-component system sensor histidine kinase QseC
MKKTGATHSLAGRLTWLIVVTSLLVWLAYAVVMTWRVQHETEQILLQQQQLMTDSLWQNLDDDEGKHEYEKSSERRQHDDEKHDENHERKEKNIALPIANKQVVFAVYDVQTGRVIRSNTVVPLPMPSNAQMRSHTLLWQGGSWRVTMRGDDKIALVMATPADVFRTVAKELTEHVAWFVLLAMLILIPLIYFVVRRTLQPVRALSEQVAQLNPHDLQPVHKTDVAELMPLHERLNDLISKVNQAMAREQRFTADAAHELRTPLAGLRLQIELAQTSERPEIRAKSLRRALQAVDRNSHLVGQLLQLARLDDARALSKTPTSLVRLARDVVEVLETDKSITLDVVHDAEINVSPALIQTLLRNLIDNAVRYGGQKISVCIDTPYCTIQDNGAGMSDEVQQRLGERFYRPVTQQAEGAGLGYSIVQRIAQLHQLILVYDSVHPDSISQKGFKVQIDFTACLNQLPNAHSQ